MKIFIECVAVLRPVILLLSGFLVACGGELGQQQSNQPPVARVQASVVSGVAPLLVEFSGVESGDPDGEIMQYQWAFGDGGESRGAIVSYSFSTPGRYTVSLTVVDDFGDNAAVEVVIEVAAADAQFSLGGTVVAMPYVEVDGDTNDPAAPSIPNNGENPGDVQPLGNPVLLNGYLTHRATGRAGDRFEFYPDHSDIYALEMEAGQYVSLQVLQPEQADLDLYLLDRSESTVVASSTSLSEFESLRIPVAGEYLLLVRAEAGASRYLLKVGYESLKPGRAINGDSGDFVPLEAVVKLQDPSPAMATKQAKSMVREGQLSFSHRERHRASLARINTLNPQTVNRLGLAAGTGFEARLERDNPRTLEKINTIRAVKALRRDSEVAAAELNYRVTTKLQPTDPFYSLQWHHPAMNMAQAWDLSTGDMSVTVAVIDTGIYWPHPEFNADAVERGFDFISSAASAGDGDGIDPDPADAGDGATLSQSSWHGTSVMGALAAQMNNGLGGAGVAPGVRLVPVRALGKDGGAIYDIIQAVRYAAGMDNDSGTVPRKPADIINMSLGGPGYSQFSQNLYNEVRRRGILVVAAAGNDNSSEHFYPASYDGVISAGALDFLGNRAYYSNFNSKVDVMAPGGDLGRDRNRDGYGDGVLSLTVGVSWSGALSADYAFSQGTSIAAPQVSGVLALMKSIYPDLSPDQVDSLLINGVITRDLGPPGRDDEYGYGALDALKAVQAAQSLARGDATVAILAEPSTLVFDFATDELKLVVTRVGDGALAVVSTETNEAWLTLEPLEVDGDQLGTYRVSVSREGLTQGNYSDQILFHTSDGSYLGVEVTLRVGSLMDTGNAGLLYVMLIDADTQETAASLLSEGEGGEYPFMFPDMPAGSYYLMAGTDINRDGVICDIGEICGYYPSFQQRQIIELSSDKADLNFVAGLYGGVFEASQVAATGRLYFMPTTFERPRP